MGSPRVTPDQKAKFAARLRDNWPISECCDFAGVSYGWGKAYAKGLRNSSGREWKASTLEAEVMGPVPMDQLKAEPKRALEDFGYFRYRYLGRLSTPWQEEAGYKVVEWMATPRKEYVVENAPPGSGKSTLHTLDIPLWLTCRNRGLRGMIGSASQTLADSYLFRLANHLVMTQPVVAEDDDRDLGLAVDAEATLIEDFGLFKLPGALWSAKKIVVAQHNDRLLTQKEATWTAWGLFTDFIGGRYSVNIWDDSVDEADFLTVESSEKIQRRWDKVAEKRCEPGGLVLLQGQRLTPDDLYAYNRGKKAGQSDRIEHDCCDAEPGAKYHLVKFRAHDETRCAGTDADHSEESPYWPNGCLLDPRRLPWRELEAEMENGIGNYMQVYQQEDGDPSQLLVNPVWVSGGTDPETNQTFPGCWDNDRGLWEIPEGAGNVLSIASTDPSPTKFWCSSAWNVGIEAPHVRWLQNLNRRSMRFDEFLERRNGLFSGLAEEWWQTSNEIGRPITHWIFEVNAAQRFMLQTQVAKDWAAVRGVTWVQHQTTATRSDPKYGPQRVVPSYKGGLCRFPGNGGAARTTSLKLIDEAQKWPKGQYDDCVMSQTFLELNVDFQLASLNQTAEPLWAPTWFDRRVSA